MKMPHVCETFGKGIEQGIFVSQLKQKSPSLKIKKKKDMWVCLTLIFFFLKNSEQQMNNHSISFLFKEPYGLGKEAKGLSRYLTVRWLFNQSGLEP